MSKKRFTVEIDRTTKPWTYWVKDGSKNKQATGTRVYKTSAGAEKMAKNLNETALPPQPKPAYQIEAERPKRKYTRRKK